MNKTNLLWYLLLFLSVPPTMGHAEKPFHYVLHGSSTSKCPKVEVYLFKDREFPHVLLTRRDKDVLCNLKIFCGDEELTPFRLTQRNFDKWNGHSIYFKCKDKVKVCEESSQTCTPAINLSD